MAGSSRNDAARGTPRSWVCAGANIRLIARLPRNGREHAIDPSRTARSTRRLPFPIGNAIWNKVRHGELTAEDGRTRVADLASSPRSKTAVNDRECGILRVATSHSTEHQPKGQ
jgi:hypothetical protein